MPDERWAKQESLLSCRPSSPFGCHSARVADRLALDVTLLLMLRAFRGAYSGLPTCHSTSACPGHPGVASRWRLSRVLAVGAAGLRRPGAHQQELVGVGWGRGDGSAGWEGRPTPTARTSWGQSDTATQTLEPPRAPLLLGRWHGQNIVKFVRASARGIGEGLQYREQSLAFIVCC